MAVGKKMVVNLRSTVDGYLCDPGGAAGLTGEPRKGSKLGVSAAEGWREGMGFGWPWHFSLSSSNLGLSLEDDARGREKRDLNRV